MIVTALLNMLSPKTGMQAQVFLTSIKVSENERSSRYDSSHVRRLEMISLAAVIVLGFVSLVKSGPGPSFSQGLFANTTSSPANFAIALYSSLWAFEGWDSSNVSSL